MQPLPTHCSLDPPLAIFVTGSNWQGLWLLNVRGYTCHVEDIASHADIQSLDLLCTTETHLRNKRGCGVMACWSFGNFTAQNIQHTASVLELLTLKLTFSAGHYLYVTTVLYWPPLASSGVVLLNLQSHVTTIPSSAPYIIVGDFKEDLAAVSIKSPIIADFLSLQFHQIIHQPTTRYALLLDHAYTHNIQKWSLPLSGFASTPGVAQPLMLFIQTCTQCSTK